jgi:hypothetical protein
MYNIKAYSAASATSSLARTTPALAALLINAATHDAANNAATGRRMKDSLSFERAASLVLATPAIGGVNMQQANASEQGRASES